MKNQKIKIALKKLTGLALIGSGNKAGCSDAIALTLNAELMRLGFTMSRELLSTVGCMTEDSAQNLAADVLTEVKCLLGDNVCLLYTSPSPRDKRQSRMPSSA